MSRPLWVFLHDDSQPDTVFPEDSFQGLITIFRLRAFQLTDREASTRLSAWSIGLANPLGNLVTCLLPDIGPDRVEI